MRTWIWDTRLIETDTNKIKAFFIEKDLNVVYLQVNNKISFHSYREFIRMMNEINVEVHALDGSPEWGLVNEKEKDQFLHWLIAYQQSSNENEQFTGIHLDIEPYLLDNWVRDQEQIVEQYQAVIVDLAEHAKQMNVIFGIDIPFWFEEIFFDNRFGEGTLAKWLVEQVDETTIMAYRDNPEDIIQIVGSEIDWANELEKKIIIAVETVELPEHYVTFHENGRKEMEKQLEEVYKLLKGNQSFSGLAIHHYESWKSMHE